MKTVLITLDSLNRHFLNPYANSEVDRIATPHIDALAKEGIVFDSHFIGSAPCMPARREMLTGCLELKHRSWGPLEPFDHALPDRLREAGSQSMLITDHFHYFEKGGENYHTGFTGYSFIRGHEKDNWKTGEVEIPPLNPNGFSREEHERNRATWKTPEDFPSYRVFAEATDWLQSGGFADSCFLYIDAFDPHEPFMVPDEYLKKVDDSGYTGDRLEWPRYGKWEGNAQELQHIRNRYRAKIMFLDDCLGGFIDTLKRRGDYEDTTIILTSDHGHYLGDHGYIGKPTESDIFNTLAHIPLFIKPAKSLDIAGTLPSRVNALSTTADIYATVCDLHGAPIDDHLYGKSLLPIISGKAGKFRDYVLYGYYGMQLGYCDGQYTFLKTPVAANQPLYYYSTRLSSLYSGTQKLSDAYNNASEVNIGRFIPNVDFPLMRFPLPEPPIGNAEQEWQGDVLYDLKNDQEQECPIRDEPLIRAYKEKMIFAMQSEDFPQEQYIRLGLLDESFATIENQGPLS